MAKSKVIVIGGGASGMMAAIIAARNGAKVTLLERKEKVGKKILATGNGRCNITNNKADYSHYYGYEPNESLVKGTLEQLSVTETIEFFSELGITMIEKEDGKLYPRSEQAASVVRALLFELINLNVNIEYEAEVNTIEAGKNFKVHTTDKTYYGNRVIMAGGGKASPDLGSNGSCYTLAKTLGHHIMEPFPAILQLKTTDPYLKHLKGTKFNGTVNLLNDKGQVIRSDYGEILFTDYGISGPPVLQISYNASKGLQEQAKNDVSIDMISELSEEVLEEYMIKRLIQSPTKTIEENLIGFIQSKLIIPVIKKSEVDIHKKSCDITKDERRRIVHTLKHYKMPVVGTQQWNQAQVTAGGVSINEIDSATLESKCCEHLYICGELLDVNGDCGGYNLQWAWSSGYVAGLAASRKE